MTATTTTDDHLTGRWLFGVCAGLSAALQFHVAIIRVAFAGVAWLFLVLFPFTISAYVIGRLGGLRAIRDTDHIDEYLDDQVRATIRWVRNMSAIILLCVLGFLLFLFLTAISVGSVVGVVVIAVMIGGLVWGLMVVLDRLSRLLNQWEDVRQDITRRIHERATQTVVIAGFATVGWLLVFALMGGAFSGFDDDDSEPPDDGDWEDE